MNRKAFIFCIILGFFSLWIGLGTAGATDHTGTLTSDETWDPAENPHNIIGNITVPGVFKLTILPGVEIFFKGNYYIRVAGEMEANGTDENRILFTRDAGTSSWSELRFYTYGGYDGAGSLSYCTIEHAYQGVDVANNATCTIDHCAIDYCTYGVYLTTSAICTIDHSTIQRCTHGIYYSQSAVNPGHVITNNAIQNNTSYGAYFYNVTDALVGAGNFIQNNKAGIYFYNCNNARVAAANTIRRNLDYGVYFGNSIEPVLLSGASECGVGVFYQDCDNIGTIDNLTFSNNAEAALKVKDCGSFRLGTSNTITGNGWPLAIDAGAFPHPASQIPTSGNLRNAIRIVSGSSDRTGTWPTFAGLDYVLTGNNTIQSGGDLTLSPGTTVRCQGGIYMRIYGKLNAVGTAENQILFTRHGTDSWGGIRFYAGSQGDIRHAGFEYGYYGIYQRQTPILVSDCLFRHNTYAIHVDSPNAQVKRCMFYFNDYGVYVAAGGTATIGGTEADKNCFEGNRTYAVQNLNPSPIIAENNYWGDPAGPNHVSHLSGRGDRVSDKVDFIPYAEVCVDVNVCEGDFDDDGDVDGSDLAVFAADFGRTDCDTGDPCEGDFDDDGDVDGSDLAVFAADFGRTDCP
jgi:nitrous oxidase accessory protein NosD